MYVPEENGFFKCEPGYSRFDYPDRIVRVTAGMGGEALLIIGSEKIAMHDLGMACFAPKLISNIHEVLDPMGRTLDYIIMSHTHYDHIGALPYVIEEFPDVKVCGSPKAEKVFKSETAMHTMEDLGEKARILYGVEDVRITARGQRLDIGLNDLDEIDLGDRKIVAYEAKGHTDCSMIYGVYGGPQTVALLNESVGSYRGCGVTDSGVLKGMEQAIEACERMKKLNFDVLIAMHYGVVDPINAQKYFDECIKVTIEEDELIKNGVNAGKTDEEIFKDHVARFWDDERNVNQPFNAYATNTVILIAKVRAREEAKRLQNS